MRPIHIDFPYAKNPIISLLFFFDEFLSSYHQEMESFLYYTYSNHFLDFHQRTAHQSVQKVPELGNAFFPIKISAKFLSSIVIELNLLQTFCIIYTNFLNLLQLSFAEN